jgi:uncharacterized protein (DUF2461 family)
MFTTATFKFLDELASNNDWTWFEANKLRYEAVMREPAQDLLRRWGWYWRSLHRTSGWISAT